MPADMSLDTNGMSLEQVRAISADRSAALADDDGKDAAHSAYLSQRDRAGRAARVEKVVDDLNAAIAAYDARP